MYRKWVLLSGGLLCTCLTLLRLYSLDADPTPLHYAGGNWHDDPGIVHNARNAALWGQFTFPDDQFNLMYVYPVNTTLTYWSFRLLGVNWKTARLPNAILGCLTVPLIGCIGFWRQGWYSSVFVMLILASSYNFLSQNRIATGETTLTFFITLTAVLLVAPARSRYSALILSFLAGITLFTAVASKLSSALFLPIVATWFILTLISEYRTAKPQGALELITVWRLLGVCCGFLIVGLVFATYWLLPNWEQIAYMHSRFSGRMGIDLSYPQRLLYAIGYTNSLHQGMPLTTVLAYGSVMSWIVFIWLNGIDKLHRIDILALCWLVGGVLLVSLSDMPVRRFVFLLPVFALSAGLFLTCPVILWSRFRQFCEGILNKIDRSYVRIAIIAVALFVPALLIVDIFGKSIVRLVFDPKGYNLDLDKEGIRPGIGVLVIAVAILIQRNSPTYYRTIALLIILGIQLGQVLSYFTDLNFTARDASRRIGQLLSPGTKVSGTSAVHLSLENQIRAYYDHTRWHPGGMNYSGSFDPIRRSDIEYLLIRSDPQLGAYSTGKIQALLKLCDPVVIDTFYVQAHWNGAQGPWRGKKIDDRYFNELLLLKKTRFSYTAEEIKRHYGEIR